MRLSFFLFYAVILLCNNTFCQNQTDNKGRKQGEWKKLYPGTKVYQYEGMFKDDKPIGVFKYYYESSKIKATLEYSENSNRTEAVYYHENGMVMSKGIYRSMKKDSIWLNYSSSGKLNSSESYKNGALDGPKIIYYLSVDLSRSSPLVSSISNYKNDVLSGEFTKYFENGSMMEKGTYIDGKREGLWINFYPGGTKESIVRYEHGLRNGWTFAYDKSGKEIAKYYYFNEERLEGKMLEKRLEELKNKGKN